jgi:hypothetical protein
VYFDPIAASRTNGAQLIHASSCGHVGMDARRVEMLSSSIQMSSTRLERIGDKTMGTKSPANYASQF